MVFELSKEAIAGFKGRVVPVELAPDLDAVAYIRQLSSTEMIEVGRAVTADGKARDTDPDLVSNVLPIMVTATLCDKDGVLLFDQSEESFNLVKMLPMTVLIKIQDEMTKLNPFSGRHAEEQAKNSQSQNTEDSSAG